MGSKKSKFEMILIRFSPFNKRLLILLFSIGAGIAFWYFYKDVYNYVKPLKVGNHSIIIFKRKFA